MVKNSPDRDILLDWKTLQVWGCIPNSFPAPPHAARRVVEFPEMDLPEATPSPSTVSILEGKGSERTQMNFRQSSEEEIETERKLKSLKVKLLSRYSDVFKKKLEPEDRIKAAPLKMDLNEKYKNITPRNSMSAAEIPAHLRKAAETELKDMLEAGFCGGLSLRSPPP